jgi:hypothetical protein
MLPVKTLLFVTGTLLPAGCSLMIDAQLDEKGASTGSGGAGGAPVASSGGSTSTSTSTNTNTTTSTTTAGGATTTTAQGASSSSGGCGAVCILDSAIAECVNGVCAIKSCDSKFDDCDKIASNGCETDLNNTPDHCGSCGHACSPGDGCKGGKCK